MLSIFDVYIVFNIFLFLFGAYIFWKVTPDLTKKSEYAVFKAFIVAFGVYLIANTLWTLQEYDKIDLPLWAFRGVCFMSLASLIFNAYFFYAYTLIHFDFQNIVRSKKANVFSVSSLAVAVVMLIVSLFNGIVFDVSESKNIVKGPLYIILPICAFVYFAVILAVSIVKAVKLRSPAARRWSAGLALLIVFLAFWVVLDDYFDRITIIPLAIFSIILSLFINMQRSGIYTDALTGMNNRRRAEEYLSAMLFGLPDDEHFFVFMADINSFKEINDSYGHPEGDDALIIMANASKNVIAEHGGFAARYGGDEFVFAWKPAKNDDTHPETVIKELQNELTSLCKKENKPYTITISVGYVRCCDKSKSIGSCIKIADEMLYENKRQFHENEARAS